MKILILKVAYNPSSRLIPVTSQENYLSFSSQRLIPETSQDNYLTDQPFQDPRSIPAAIKRFLQSPAELKLPTINPQAEWRLSFSVPHRIFRYSPVKISSRQESPVDWHTTQAPDSPTVVPRLLIFNNQRIFNPLQQSRNYFPRKQSRFFYLQPSRIHLSSARQLISLHAHSSHSYHKHWRNAIHCIIHIMQHNFVFS